MTRKIHGLKRSMALLPMVNALIGCAPAVSPIAESNSANPERGATQPPARAIISFDHSIARDVTSSEYLSSSQAQQKLVAAIAEACHCPPVFIRPDLGDTLIYELALPAGYTFSAFQVELMRNAGQLGIKAVDQDSLLQHQ